MTKDPATVTMETSVINAYALMERRGIRRLPVVAEDGVLRGIITRSDVQQVAPFFKDAEERVDAMFALAGKVVEEIMTDNPITVAPHDPIQLAAKRMSTARVSGLPVVRSSQVVGIITESDIFRYVVSTWSDPEAYD
ncbi:MAG: CBS domain-containing protein [Chloroflexales bacterium]|nr:CBS domain-containing protein [Chloroflexales bacterium]